MIIIIINIFGYWLFVPQICDNNLMMGSRTEKRGYHPARTFVFKCATSEGHRARHFSDTVKYP